MSIVSPDINTYPYSIWFCSVFFPHFFILSPDKADASIFSCFVITQSIICEIHNWQVNLNLCCE